MGRVNVPTLPNLEPLIAAGIDPRTGLPVKMGGTQSTLKQDIRRFIRIQDEQDAVNRYVWYNLPGNLTSQELERLLYYKGQLCFFYNEELNQFFFLPYALDGTIDLYGRFNTIHPVPMAEGTTQDEKAQIKRLADWLSTLSLTVRYGVVLPENLTLEDLTKSTVLLRDYTNQLSQTIVPRQVINDCIIDIEADCLPFMRTALLNGTGVRGVRVNNEDEAFQVFEASKSMNDAALAGQKYLPMIGEGLDFQDFTDGTIAKSEEFLLAMQSLDNIRLSGYGIENGGIFQKQERKLVAEADMAAGSVSFALQDGLAQRQAFCDIVNSIWGIGITCEVSEIASGMDKNGDMEISQEQDQSGTMEGEQPQ